MKNYRYAVSIFCYDNGKVEISKPYKVDFSVESSQKECPRWDHYVNVFNSLKEARQFVEDNKNYKKKQIK